MHFSLINFFQFQIRKVIITSDLEGSNKDINDFLFDDNRETIIYEISIKCFLLD